MFIARNTLPFEESTLQVKEGREQEDFHHSRISDAKYLSNKLFSGIGSIIQNKTSITTIEAVSIFLTPGSRGLSSL